MSRTWTGSGTSRSCRIRSTRLNDAERAAGKVTISVDPERYRPMRVQTLLNRPSYAPATYVRVEVEFANRRGVFTSPFYVVGTNNP